MKVIKWTSAVWIIGVACSTEATLEVKTPSDTQNEVNAPPCVERALRFAGRASGVQRQSTLAWASFQRGQKYVKEYDWVLAEESFREALKLNPELGLAHLELAEVLAHTGGSTETRRRHFAAAVLDLPRNPRAHHGFADTLENLGDVQGALKHLRCALELRPSLRRARRQATRLALELEGFDAAHQLLLPLLNQPKVSDLLLAGEIYAAGQNLQASAQAIQEAAQVSASARLHQQAALAWTRAGDTSRAQAARRRAQELDPRKRRRMRELPAARR